MIAERGSKVKNARSAVVRIIVMMVLVIVERDGVFGGAWVRSLGLPMIVVLMIVVRVLAIVVVRWLGARRRMIMVLIFRIMAMPVPIDLGVAVMRVHRTALLLRVVVVWEVDDRVTDVNVIGAMEGMVKRRRYDGAVTIDKDRPGPRRKRAKTPPHHASQYESRAELDGLSVGTHARGPAKAWAGRYDRVYPRFATP